MIGDVKGRILKELEEFQKANETGEEQKVNAKVMGDELKHWKGTIFGPQDSAYEGGIFKIDILIPNEYPFKPPKMRFETKVWHPNISSQTGAICLDILKDEWTPALTIRTALISLQALLCTPEADDPQDAEVAKQFKTNPKAFEAKAKEWTKNFAKSEEAMHKEKVNKLMEMGFDEQSSIGALEKFDYDENLALNHLLG